MEMENIKRFQINATLKGEPVLLSIETLEAPVQSTYSFYSVSKGGERLAVMKMDGECKIESTSDELFDEEDIQNLCTEISRYLERDDADISIIRL
jgi:hypothetical protein